MEFKRFIKMMAFAVGIGIIFWVLLLLPFYLCYANEYEDGEQKDICWEDQCICWYDYRALLLAPMAMGFITTEVTCKEDGSPVVDFPIQINREWLPGLIREQVTDDKGKTVFIVAMGKFIIEVEGQQEAVVVPGLFVNKEVKFNIQCKPATTTTCKGCTTCPTTSSTTTILITTSTTTAARPTTTPTTVWEEVTTIPTTSILYATTTVQPVTTSVVTTTIAETTTSTLLPNTTTTTVKDCSAICEERCWEKCGGSDDVTIYCDDDCYEQCYDKCYEQCRERK